MHAIYINPNPQEPLEAGEDGTFDLGSPSPPASPAKPVDIPVRVARSQDAADDDSGTPAAETEPEPACCGSPPIADDWEKVDLKGATDADIGPPAGGSPAPPEEPPLEEFEDAVEMKPPQQQGTETSVGSGSSNAAKEPKSKGFGQAAQAPAAVEPSGCRPSPSAEQPAAAAAAAGGKAATAIAAGLANVRLPLGGRGRQAARVGGEPTASDGEEEFHDAHDSGPGMVKDATKAREMKEIGNG